MRLCRLARALNRVFRLGNPQPVLQYRVVVLPQARRRANTSLRSAVESDAEPDLRDVVPARRANAIQQKAGEQIVVLGDLVEAIDGTGRYPRFGEPLQPVDPRSRLQKFLYTSNDFRAVLAARGVRREACVPTVFCVAHTAPETTPDAVVPQSECQRLVR